MITLKVKVANSFIKQVKGLISQENITPILFKTRFGIHTFGMKVPLDILVLDNDYRIVKIKEKLVPNHFFFWNPYYQIIVELPLNTIVLQGMKVGDKVKLEIAN